MVGEGDSARIFVGADRSQLIAVKVLEYSIRRRTSLPISLRSTHDLELPEPKDPRQGKRTGFSFVRFAVPELAGHQGRAVYLDADMLVLRDFRELWGLPFDGAKVIIQEGIPDAAQPVGKLGAPNKRIKQCSVMLMDCAALDWEPRSIIAGLGERYTYEQLVYELCLLNEQDVNYGVPFVWNSLEHYDAGKTGLIHYTDMLTQPWVNPDNRNGFVWHDEVRAMLADGAMTYGEIEQEIALGYLRPSLVVELREIEPGRALTSQEIKRLNAIDNAGGFVMHKDVYAAKRRRQEAIRTYEKSLGISVSPLTRAADTLQRAGLLSSLRRRLGV